MGPDSQIKFGRESLVSPFRKALHFSGVLGRFKASAEPHPKSVTISI
jgi:hypothetical protein